MFISFVKDARVPGSRSNKKLVLSVGVLALCIHSAKAMNEEPLTYGVAGKQNRDATNPRQRWGVTRGPPTDFTLGTLFYSLPGHPTQYRCLTDKTPAKCLTTRGTKYDLRRNCRFNHGTDCWGYDDIHKKQYATKEYQWVRQSQARTTYNPDGSFTTQVEDYCLGVKYELREVKDPMGENPYERNTVAWSDLSPNMGICRQSNPANTYTKKECLELKHKVNTYECWRIHLGFKDEFIHQLSTEEEKGAMIEQMRLMIEENQAKANRNRTDLTNMGTAKANRKQRRLMQRLQESEEALNLQQ